MLEDDVSDVLAKAMRGCGLDQAGLRAASGLDEATLRDALQGTLTPASAQACAAALGLRAEALLALHRHHPQRIALPGLQQLDLPFGEARVNAWWVACNGVRLLFDSGLDVGSLSQALPDLPDQCWITHMHRDHIGGLDLLRSKGVVVRGVPVAGSILARPGDVIDCGRLQLRVHDLSGHALPALGYEFALGNRTVLVVGDALFAGSIGRCDTPDRYQLALSNLRAVLDPLPDDTVLLPGHGPATTLGEERRGNPFL
ncbi:MAG TPA: MBL fold metallo-hydrolase [Luteolibacter sp.]|nr:MBL fold metallo-hydrolase [Luteolibacter sp.]